MNPVKKETFCGSKRLSRHDYDSNRRKRHYITSGFIPEDPVGNDLIRQVPGRRWSYSRRCWVVPNTRHSVVKIGHLFGKEYCRFDERLVRLYKPDATPSEVEKATNPVWPPADKALPRRKSFRYVPPAHEYSSHPVIVAVSQTLRVQNYSHKTLRNYKQALITLIRYVGKRPLEELTSVQYQDYLLFLLETKRLSPATLNVHINGWKFYQEKVLGRPKQQYDIAYPRLAHKLPTVYSVEEVKAITSLRYRTLFQLVYATGMRVSEVAALRRADLDSVRRLITVRGGKGKKDRVVMFSEKLTILVNEYLNRYQPKTYVFEDAETKEPLTTRVIQQVYSARYSRSASRSGAAFTHYDIVLPPTSSNRVPTSGIYNNSWAMRVF